MLNSFDYNSMFLSILGLLFFTSHLVDATVSCIPGDEGDAFCEQKYRKGSYCIEDEKICSNPFVSGCLRSFDDTLPKRVCNSDDEVGSTDCRRSDFQDYYQEIRVLSHNWESAMFTASITQILLSELLEVPSTIEISGPDGSCNFYDKSLPFSYAKISYDFDAMITAFENPNCTTVERTKESYTSCAHVMTEVWNGQFEKVTKYEEEGILAPSTGSGAMGKISWFVPSFTATEHPSVVSYLGLTTNVSDYLDGINRRHELARIFQRPRTWKDYCTNFTEDNCQNPPYYDEENRIIATRAPNSTKGEDSLYFSEGSFHGHFAPADENNCTANPTTCTGNFLNVKCDWSTFVWQQAHHLQIPISGHGDADAVGGYSYR